MSDHPTMPVSIIRLAETIGWPVALKLIQYYPGMRMRVPVKLKEGHPLIAQLGADGAAKLVKLCPDEEIFIPKADKHMRAKRNVRIVSEYSAGAKVPDLARKYDLTDRQIYSILSEPVFDEKQLSIF